ncbi:hypothetical protein AC18_4818 [Escherichia coli 2-222-05_S3_C2]|nr:hypothetical protein AC27_4371 [Escherichia coli 1-182-04_S3_C2]EZJ86950.1 hypothetical protein AB99_4729 [Escherichia coli 1-182-04_S3_C1]KEN93896.1 hypothetical protein AC18_4818 [Escherichia coli 2-222-05_S3_C2]KIO85997.1 hypothetical protein EC970264_4835 [Escherichia coli 97.0264]
MSAIIDTERQFPSRITVNKNAYILTLNSYKPFALTKYCIKCLHRF